MISIIDYLNPKEISYFFRLQYLKGWTFDQLEDRAIQYYKYKLNKENA